MSQSKFSINSAFAFWACFGPPLWAQTLPDWVQADSAGRTVSLTLETTPSTDSGTGLINGHHAGDIQLVVPLGWTVRWSWRNGDTTAPHSLVVMAEREKLPLEGGRAALDNAMSRMVTAGLKPGRTDQTSFVAD